MGKDDVSRRPDEEGQRESSYYRKKSDGLRRSLRAKAPRGLHDVAEPEHDGVEGALAKG